MHTCNAESLPIYPATYTKTNNRTVCTSSITLTMKRPALYLLALAVCWVNAARAQHQSLYYKVHFDSDQHLLDTADQHTLNQLAVMAKQATYYEINIQAHTDADADHAYNAQLSKLRAVSVKHYLAACGLKPEVLFTQSFGENKPEGSNRNEEGKAQNRRVEITLNTYHFANSGEFLQAIAPDNKQQFPLNAAKGGVLTGTDGTKVYIPANALVTADNKPVKGEVTVELQEFLHADDAFYHQLSTTSNGRLLESGGMFSLEASSNGQPVQIKPGASVRVTIPAVNAQNNMMLFVPVNRGNGVIDWLPTQVPFGPIPAVDYTFTPTARVFLDNTLLKNMLVNNKAPEAHASFTYPLLTLPKRPVTQLTAPRYAPPVYNSYFSLFTRIFRSHDYLMAELAKETQRREQIYQKKMQTYLAQKQQYDEALEQYLADSARLVQNWTRNFQEWAGTQATLHQMWAEYLNRQQWNNAVKDLMDLNGITAFSTHPQLVQRFSESISPSQGSFLSAARHQQAANALQELEQMSYEEIARLLPYASEIDLNNKRLRQFRTNSGNRLRSFSSSCIAENSQLWSHLHMAQNDWVKRIKDEKNQASNEAEYLYNTTINRFGVYNCDRFSQTPPEQMAKVVVKHSGNAQVAFHIPSTRSFVYSYKTDNGYYINLPKNTEATMVFLSFHPTEGPMLQIKKLNVNTTNVEVIAEPQTVAVADIRKAFTNI